MLAWETMRMHQVAYDDQAHLQLHLAKVAGAQ